MTTSSVSKIGTGSMPPMSGTPTGSGKETEPRWLLRLSRRWGKSLSYTKALVFDRQRSVFRMVAEATEEMLTDGHEQLADRRLLDLELVRAGIDPTTGEFRAVVLEDAAADAAEDVARTAFLQSPTPENRRTLVRSCGDVLRRKLRLSRALERA